MAGMRRLVLLGLILAGSCIAPARTFDGYKAKAVTTAEEVVSAAQTALLTVRAANASRSFAPSITTTLTDAERDAGAVAGTFDSITPPDERSDRLRETLDRMLQEVTSILGELRIAARRGELHKLPAISKDLSRLTGELEDFIEEHS
jgi:hypothetical protein